jgi:uncharacterized protein (TIGR04562 family)
VVSFVEELVSNDLWMTPGSWPLSELEAPTAPANALDAADLEMPWEMLGSIIGGQSGLDIPALDLRSPEQAEEFLACYGYHWRHSGDRAIMEHCRGEALAFIQEELLEGTGLQVPPEIAQEEDLRQLLLLASRRPLDVQQRWACALLRVMHTVAHSRSYFNQRYGAQIRQQVLERFEPHLGHNEQGDLVLGHGDTGIVLEGFEVKQAKSLRSVVMKLLHKAENVAADVFDRIGVRIITKERFDALLAVRYLQGHHVLMFANIKPSRSRNTLIQVDWLREEMAMLDQLVEAGRLSPQERLQLLRERVRQQPYPSEARRDWNRHSSIDYHAIQFTCRQMIHAHEGKDELRFFFPYEVQIMDQESYRISRSGLASHDEYKKRQRDAVRKRVLGPLLT